MPRKFYERLDLFLFTSDEMKSHRGHVINMKHGIVISLHLFIKMCILTECRKFFSVSELYLFQNSLSDSTGRVGWKHCA